MYNNNNDNNNEINVSAAKAIMCDSYESRSLLYDRCFRNKLKLYFNIDYKCKGSAQARYAFYAYNRDNIQVH